MGRNRFVAPLTVRLDLSDGDWIEVKERLTYGEQQRISSSGVKYRDADGLVLDLEKSGVTRLLTWIADWSFVGPDDKQRPVTKEAIWELDPGTAREIDAALSEHISEQFEKNVTKPPKTESKTKS